MSVGSCPSVRIPGPSGSLCALLALLLLLTPPEPFASAGPVAVVVRELRCMCLDFVSGLHPKMISNLQVIAAGPQCPKVEVIGQLKSNGKEICLNPEAPLIKKVIQRILDSGKKKTD